MSKHQTAPFNDSVFVTIPSFYKGNEYLEPETCLPCIVITDLTGENECHIQYFVFPHVCIHIQNLYTCSDFIVNSLLRVTDEDVNFKKRKH